MNEMLGYQPEASVTTDNKVEDENKPKSFFSNIAERLKKITKRTYLPTLDTKLTNGKRVSRRSFLLGSAAAVGSATLGYALKHPSTAEKIIRSISSGEALGDIQEIASSRLRLGNSEITLSETDSNYTLEPWMKEVADTANIREVQKGDEKYPLLIFDVTNTVSVLPAIKKVEQKSDSSLEKITYDLTPAIDESAGLTLPGPQYALPQIPGKIAHYAQYLLYARNHQENESGSLLELSRKRGGVVLSDKGFQVVSDEELVTYADLIKNPSVNGQVKAVAEYAFYIDSANLESTLQAITTDNTSFLKDPAYTTEYASTLVTIYLPGGEFKTFLLSNYEPDKTRDYSDSSSELISFNILQLSSLADQLCQQMHGSRYVLVIPDPSPEASNCYSSQSITKEEIDRQGFAYDPESNDTEDASYYRVIGSLAPYARPNRCFPWVFQTHKN